MDRKVLTTKRGEGLYTTESECYAYGYAALAGPCDFSHFLNAVSYTHDANRNPSTFHVNSLKQFNTCDFMIMDMVLMHLPLMASVSG